MSLMTDNSPGPSWYEPDDYPDQIEDCPDCGGFIVGDANGDPVCEECGRVWSTEELAEAQQ